MVWDRTTLFSEGMLKKNEPGGISKPVLPHADYLTFRAGPWTIVGWVAENMAPIDFMVWPHPVYFPCKKISTSAWKLLNHGCREANHQILSQEHSWKLDNCNQPSCILASFAPQGSSFRDYGIMGLIIGHIFSCVYRLPHVTIIGW